MGTYRTVAWAYDLLAAAYSGGRIEMCKQAYIAALPAGSRVLFTGVGTGSDAVAAASRSVWVTAVERSPHMLARLRSRHAHHGERVARHLETIEGDVLEHVRCGYYDAVVANFFLNTFSQSRLQETLAHLIRLLRPGGRIVIGDFASPRGGRASRFLQALPHHLPMLTFRLLTGSDLHPIHDYRPHLTALGAEPYDSRVFAAFGLGPARYESLVARKLPCR